MTISLIDAESLLALDMGTINTRASLFDVVEGKYQFIAAGSASSTVNPSQPYSAGSLYNAIRNLQKICGRRLLESGIDLILPAQANGTGVDRVALTHSVSPLLRMVLVGLLNDVSLESAQRLVDTVQGEVVARIDLNDRRGRAEQVDAILEAKPDLIILTGGTENGASWSVYELVEIVALACQVLPPESRPAVLYTGNEYLAKNIKDFLGKWTQVEVAPNIRPEIERENLIPAQDLLGRIVTEIRLGQLGGLSSVAGISSIQPLPASHAFGRMVRFLSRLYDPQRGVIGIDLGASSLSVAASISGKMQLSVFPWGMGSTINTVLEHSRMEEITQWLPFDTPVEAVRDYIWQKSVYPSSIPVTPETLAIEQSVARQALRLAMQQFLQKNPGVILNHEPFLVSGSTLTQTASPMNSLMLLLDGIQPVGVTTFVLDQNHLLSSLGAAASTNAILPVQILESGAFLNLGCIISPITRARIGQTIIRARLEYDDGHETRFEVKKGTIQALPLQPGQGARIHLQGLGRTIIDPQSGAHIGSFRIIGGACGAVIDGRGRPLVLPTQPGSRWEMIRKWQASLGL